MWMTQCLPRYSGGREGSPIKRTHFKLQPALGVAETTRYGLRVVLLMGEHSLPPPLSTKVDTDVIHVIKYTRPPPSIFA